MINGKYKLSSRFLIYAIAVSILTLWFPDYSFNDNSVSRALAVISLVEDNKLFFDKYEHLTGDKSLINGHVYSDKAPFPVFFVYPFIKIAQITDFLPGSIEGKLKFVLITGGIIVSTFPLIILLIYLFINAEKEKVSFKNYWLITMPFMGSFLWVYNNTFYSHILAGFLLCVIYILFEKKKYVSAGLISGFLFLTEYPVIVIPAIWLFQYTIALKKFKIVKGFVLGILPSAFVLLLYNYTQSGSFFNLGYSYVSESYSQMRSNYGFGSPSLSAIWGMTFSPYRGLLFFAPLFFPIIFIAAVQLYKEKQSFIKHPWFIPLVFYIILISGYFMWWGGWSFGPRHLIPVVLFVFFYEIQKKYMYKYFLPLFIIGMTGVVFILFIKSTLMYNFPSGLNPFTGVIIPAIDQKVLNPMNVLTICFNVNPIISSVIWLLIYILSGVFMVKPGNKIGLA